MKIEIKNLSKNFKKVNILNSINLTFESGTIYGLIGRNGTGKSVFLKTLCGFYYPSSGEILFDGKNYSANNLYPDNLRSLIEKPSFMPNLTGYENLELLASIQNKIGKSEIEETLKKVNLFEEKDKKYSKYSLGMKQKLGIAQVLMENPEIIILDEPFNAIEEETVNKIKNILLEEKSKGKLIILSSHIKDDINSLADIILTMNNGTIEVQKNMNQGI